jgi:hypothetical protein
MKANNGRRKEVRREQQPTSKQATRMIVNDGHPLTLRKWKAEVK